MYDIISIGEKRSLPLELDSYQKSGTSFIINQYFVWTCLVLFLNSNWKRPVIIVLILHWFLRSMGDFCFYFIDIHTREHNEWPYCNNCWLYSYGIASIFWFTSEIIGDWYPFLRTSAIVKNHHKLRYVFITCLLYNIVKIIQMYVYIFYIPFRKVQRTPNMTDDEYDKIVFDYYVQDKNTYKLYQWCDIVLQLIFSFLYDISVINALRKGLFNKLKATTSTRENQFLNRFKQISEYRIFLSVIGTVVVFPVIVSYAIYIAVQLSKNEDAYADNEAESIRQSVLRINYTFMYIDQILLRYYIDHNDKYRKISKSTNSSSNNFNLVYSGDQNNSLYYSTVNQITINSPTPHPINNTNQNDMSLKEYLTSNDDDKDNAPMLNRSISRSKVSNINIDSYKYVTKEKVSPYQKFIDNLNIKDESKIN